MKDRDKSKEQLISELGELRQRVAELEAADAERKHAEEALRESEERYRQSVENSPNPIFSVDGEGMVQIWNQACVQVFQYGAKEIVGQTYHKLLWNPEDRSAIESLLTEVWRGHSLSGRDMIYRSKDGTQRFTVSRLYPILDREGGVSGCVFANTDITDRRRAEEALRESEVRYRTLFETMAQGVVYQSGDGRIVSANPAAERILGLTLDQMQGRTSMDPRWKAIREDGTDFPGDAHPAMVALRTGKEVRNVVMGVFNPRKEGHTWIHVNAVPQFKSWEEKPYQVYTTFEDITERVQAEEALRESEERARNIVESIPMGMHMYQLEPDGRLVFVGANPAADEILGVDNGQFVDKTIEEAFPPLTETEIPERYRVAASSGESWQTDQVDYEEGQIKGAFEVHAFQTSPGRMVAAFLDITERKQAEEERERLLAQIREQAQRLQHILDAVPEGVLLLDADEQIILVNPVAERELVALADAKTGDALTHLGDRPLAELLTSPPKGLWHEVAADGRIFQVIARSIEGGPTPIGWVMVIRDVTQQREMQQRVQQQERLAAVGQLAAGVAHDFNNIMATVVLYAQMTARMEGLPAVVRERMGTIHQQAGHATYLIQQILDFSRRAVLERRPLDLAPLLKEHIKLLERTLPESIEIKLGYEAGEYVVNADPTRMQQMITNLALNAREAMRGGGELRIGLERIEIKPGESPLLPEMEPGEWVRVKVSDTGTGIPPDVLPHIFEPFFTTRAPLGSGLGLAQVHGIVGAHEGRIDVETQVGHGTTFTIYLPVHPSEPSPVLSRAELSALPTGEREIILVVEDDAVVRKALADSLQLLNYRVLEVANGQEALEMLEQRKGEIALVLSDVVMPRMSGIALLHALKERGLAVRVVMLTGHPLKREMEKLRAQGMADWLPKPPQLEQLAEVVARALNKESD